MLHVRLLVVRLGDGSRCSRRSQQREKVLLPPAQCSCDCSRRLALDLQSLACVGEGNDCRLLPPSSCRITTAAAAAVRPSADAARRHRLCMALQRQRQRRRQAAAGATVGQDVIVLRAPATGCTWTHCFTRRDSASCQHRRRRPVAQISACKGHDRQRSCSLQPWHGTPV